jgi:spermidine synthase
MAKILVVDDEIGIRELLSEILSDEGYDVVLAENAAAARAARLANRPDVVLLDGYDDSGIAPSFANGHFYRSLAASLSPRGLLVCNLAQKNADSEEHLALLREEFGEVLILPVPEEGNRIAFALREAGPLPDPAALRRTARVLARQIDLPFELFAQRLARSR